MILTGSRRRKGTRLLKVWTVFLFCLFLGVPSMGLAGEVVLDWSATQGTFENIAGGINFWGPAELQQRFKNEVGERLFRLKLRLHQVEWDQDTGTYSNFSLGGVAHAEIPDVVASADQAANAGCKILVQIYGIPLWLSTSQDDRVVTNGVPNYAKYPPQDYLEWARVVYAGIQALKRAGLSRIDYVEVFGEPNCGSTWYQQMMPCIVDGEVEWECEPNELGHDTFQIMQNFLRIYKYTAMGAQAAEPGVLVGGPAIVPNTSGIWWTRYLLRFLQFYGQPVDFFSWHGYGVDEDLTSALEMIAPHAPLTQQAVVNAYKSNLENRGFPPAYVNAFLNDIYDYLKDLELWGQAAVHRPYSFISSNLNRMMEEEGCGASELMLTEWNVNHAWDNRHDTHYGASFITRALMDLTDSQTDEQTYYSLSCWPFSEDGGYGGRFSLFTMDGSKIPKASFNAFKLFSMLGESTDRVSVSSADDDVYAMGTTDAGGVSLLATHYMMAQDPANPDYSLNTSVTLKVINLPFSIYYYDVYLIDGYHSNSYYGSGPDLEIVSSGSGVGDFEKTMTLDIYGVVMVRIQQGS